MQMTVIGCGYVGLVTATCFAEMGNRVCCVDSNAKRVDALQHGVAPIFEPGIEPMIQTNQRAGRLTFSTELDTACARSEVIFIAVGTPPAADGAADISQVLADCRGLQINLSGGHRLPGAEHSGPALPATRPQLAPYGGEQPGVS